MAEPFQRKKSGHFGQAAVEVLVYVGFFLLIFVVINLFFILQVSGDISQRQYALAQTTAGQLSDDLQMALLAGPGFNASFLLPSNINGHRYVAQFYKSSLYVIVDSAPVPGVGDASSYATRLYYPLGTSNVKLKCLKPTAGCFGENIAYGPAVYQQYDFTAASGRIRIVNAPDSEGQPQLQIVSVS